MEFLGELSLLLLGMVLAVIFIPILIGIAIAVLFSAVGFTYFAVVIGTAVIFWLILIFLWV